MAAFSAGLDRSVPLRLGDHTRGHEHLAEGGTRLGVGQVDAAVAQAHDARVAAGQVQDARLPGLRELSKHLGEGPLAERAGDRLAH